MLKKTYVYIDVVIFLFKQQVIRQKNHYFMEHFLRASYGVQLQLHIRLKEDGMLMEKEKAFGISLLTLKGILSMDQQETQPAIGKKNRVHSKMIVVRVKA